MFDANESEAVQHVVLLFSLVSVMQSMVLLYCRSSTVYIFFTKFNRWTGKTRLKNRNVTLLWDYDLSQITRTSLCEWIPLYRHRSHWTACKIWICKFKVKRPKFVVEKSRSPGAPVVLFLWLRNGETHRCICAVGNKSWRVCVTELLAVLTHFTVFHQSVSCRI